MIVECCSLEQTQQGRKGSATGAVVAVQSRGIVV